MPAGGIPVWHGDDLSWSGGGCPFVIEMDPSRAPGLDGDHHLDPGIVFRWGFDNVFARLKGHNFGGLGIMAGGIAHAFDQVAMQIVDAVVGMLMPNRFAIAGLVLVVTARPLAREDLQEAH